MQTRFTPCDIQPDKGENKLDRTLRHCTWYPAVSGTARSATGDHGFLWFHWLQKGCWHVPVMKLLRFGVCYILYNARHAIVILKITSMHTRNGWDFYYCSVRGLPCPRPYVYRSCRMDTRDLCEWPVTCCRYSQSALRQPCPTPKSTYVHSSATRARTYHCDLWMWAVDANTQRSPMTDRWSLQMSSADAEDLSPLLPWRIVRNTRTDFVFTL